MTFEAIDTALISSRDGMSRQGVSPRYYDTLKREVKFLNSTV